MVRSNSVHLFAVYALFFIIHRHSRTICRRHAIAKLNRESLSSTEGQFLDEFTRLCSVHIIILILDAIFGICELCTDSLGTYIVDQNHQNEYFGVSINVSY